MAASSPEREDKLTWMASGLVAVAVLCALAAATAIWLYRQAAVGWAAPDPSIWRALTIVGMAFAGLAVLVSVIAVWRRSGPLGRGGAVTWAVLSLAVLLGIPIVVGRLAPEGRHAVVVAIDASTGVMRWRSETPAWFLRRPAIEGDVVTLLAIGDERGPCEPRIRRLTLGLADGSKLSLDSQTASTAQTPAKEFRVQGRDLVHAIGETERWRVTLDSLGLPWASAVVSVGDTVIVTADGRAPLECRG